LTCVVFNDSGFDTGCDHIFSCLVFELASNAGTASDVCLCGMQSHSIIANPEIFP
jgi:hypothetical protein